MGNKVIYDIKVLKSNLCNYNNPSILVKDDVTIVVSNLDGTTKIDVTIIEDAEDLDLFVLMYNFLEYSSDYSDTTISLQFYSKDEAANLNSDTEGYNNLSSIG